MKKYEEFQKTLDRFTSDESFLTVSMSFTLFSDDKMRLDENIETLENMLSQKKYNFITETDIAPFSFRQALPFCYDPMLNSFMARSINVFSNDLANQIPVAGGWKPGKGRALVFPSVERSLVLFDLFTDSTAPHFIVVGATGTGKSFTTNFIVAQYLRYNPYIYIIDKGSSYKKLSDIFEEDSQYISLDSTDKSICVNPLTCLAADRDEYGRGVSLGGQEFQLVDSYGYEVNVSLIRRTKGEDPIVFDSSLEENKGVIPVVLNKDKTVEIDGLKGFVNKVGDLDFGEEGVVVMASDKNLSADRISYFKQILGEMISEGRDKETPLKEERNDIAEAVAETFEKDRSQQYLLMSDILRELIREEGGEAVYVHGRSLYNKLKNYAKDISGKGRSTEFGDMFDGAPTVDLEKRFVVFETQKIQMLDCKTVLLLSIMNLIRNNVLSPEKNGIPKFFIMDEAWSLLNDSDDVSAFIDSAYREFRKYGCAVGCISQMINDIADVAQGALMENSKTQFLMKHTKNSANNARKVDSSISNLEAKMLENLVQVKGHYNQMLLRTEDLGSVRCYLFPMPDIYWLATTAPDDKKIWEKVLADKKGDVSAALRYVVENYPNGAYS